MGNGVEITVSGSCSLRRLVRNTFFLHFVSRDVILLGERLRSKALKKKKKKPSALALLSSFLAEPAGPAFSVSTVERKK